MGTTTSKRPGIVDVLSRLLGSPSQHPTRHGPWWRCPFCRSGVLSLRADPWTNEFRCFECDAEGDVLDFVARRHKVSRQAAAARLHIPCFPQRRKEDSDGEHAGKTAGKGRRGSAASSTCAGGLPTTSRSMKMRRPKFSTTPPRRPPTYKRRFDHFHRVAELRSAIGKAQAELAKLQEARPARRFRAVRGEQAVGERSQWSGWPPPRRCHRNRRGRRSAPSTENGTGPTDTRRETVRTAQAHESELGRLVAKSQLETTGRLPRPQTPLFAPRSASG